MRDLLTLWRLRRAKGWLKVTTFAWQESKRWAGADASYEIIDAEMARNKRIAQWARSKANDLLAKAAG